MLDLNLLILEESAYAVQTTTGKLSPFAREKVDK